MADLYFKKFEKIYYLTRVGNKEELKVLTDITTNVRLRKKILQNICLLYTSPSPRDRTRSRMPSSA